MPVVAFSGPDGSGKTTALSHFIRALLSKGTDPNEIVVLHANPVTRRLKRVDSKIAQALIMFDKFFTYFKVAWYRRRKEWVVLDRCFVDAIVYTELFGGIITKLINKFVVAIGRRIAAPDVVFVIIAPPEVEAQRAKNMSEETCEDLNLWFLDISPFAPEYYKTHDVSYKQDSTNARVMIYAHSGRYPRTEEG